MLTLEGFIVTPSAPSVHLLNTTIDITELSNDEYIALRDELSDYINTIDIKYAKRNNLKGRTIESKFVKADDYKRHVIVMSPIPSAYINKLITIRVSLYERILPIYTHPIDINIDGGFKKRVYLATISNLESIYNAIDNINVEIHSLNADINRFQISEDFYRFIGILVKYNVKHDTRTITLPDIRIDALSIALSRPTIDSMIEAYKDKLVNQAMIHAQEEIRKLRLQKEEEIRRVNMLVEEEIKKKKSILSRLKDDMERRRQIYEDILKKDIQEKLLNIVKQISETGKVTNRTKEYVESIKATIADMNLDSYNEIVNAIETAINSKNKIETINTEVARITKGGDLHTLISTL